MFISRHTLKWTKTCRSSGDFPHAHTAHFLLNRHRGVLPLYWRALSSMNAISVLAYRLVATLAAMVALLVAFSVLATAIPLAMFSYGVQHSHYLTVSFIQYLNPLIQFCVAVLLLHEPMRAQGYAAFMVIWVAIAVYSFGAIWAYWERLKPHAR